MLKLRRVELHGFKSFCDRTELRFQGDGVAAIVGPNGCGKSNISDAISWVLGEQSAKTLRGTRMEDVIFAGTNDRKPLGMAYVTMTMVDPELYHEGAAHKLQAVEGALPHGPAEVTITRRLYRSGESEYLVDGRLARLRDIQELFMGTGLGPESYAIIEQGRIGQILSSKPQDRRGVIEEAAGITKFKTRKRLAEAKLESAKQNLARVYDILEEVNRQVNSLKRQAAKARRFSELKADLEARLRVVLSGKFRWLERDAAQTAIELNMATAELKTLGEQVAEKEKAHELARAACDEIEERLTAERQALAEASVEAERTRGKLDAQVKQSGSIEQRIAEQEKESQELGLRLDALEAEIANHRASLESLEAEISKTRDRMLEINRQRESLQAKMREREKNIESGRQVILRLLGEASTLKNQLAQIDEYLASIDRETARSTREEQTAAAEIERLDGLKKQISATLAERQLELETVTGERRRTEQDLGEKRSLASELKLEIDGLKNEIAAMRARKESLEQVLSHRSYTTESVKRLFASLEKGNAGDLKPLGVLADFVEVDPQYEKPAEEFLHDELEYVVVENWQQAERGLDFLRAELEGRATFLVHPEPDGNGNGHLPEPAIGPETGIAARLSDSLAPHQRLQRPRRGPAAARLAVLPGRGSRLRAAAFGGLSASLFPAARTALCYHGHTVTGGRRNPAPVRWP